MATLKEIAELSGVSIASVSRVLNQDEKFSISEKTKLKILQAAESLQYKGSMPASGRGKAEGVLRIALVMLYSEFQEITDSYYLTVRVNAKEEAQRMGMSVQEYFCGENDEELPRFDAEAGIIVLGHTGSWFGNEALRHQIMESGLPVVMADFNPKDEALEYDCVVNDFKGIMEKALGYFMKLGYKEIGYVGSEGIPVGDQLILDSRYIYFKQILELNGCYQKDLVFLDPGSVADAGYRAMKQAIGQNRIPRAVFIENDSMAIGCLKALKEHGIQIPDQVAIISCNDIPNAEFLTPALSSVRIYSDLIGVMAARMLAERVETKRVLGVKVIAPSKLMIRQSCGTMEGKEERGN